MDGGSHGPRRFAAGYPAVTAVFAIMELLGQEGKMCIRDSLDAVLMMARRLNQPNTMQAIWHGEAFEQLLQHAPDLSVLDLGHARIHAWRGACARVARIRNIPRWLSENRVKLALTAVCAVGLVFMYQDARDGTTYKDPPPARAKPVSYTHLDVYKRQLRHYAST